MNSKTIITRRQALVTGIAGIGGLLFSQCNRPMAPTYGSILRMGDNLTYAAHRALLPARKLVREYDFKDISSMPATGTTNPASYSEDYDKAFRKSFSEWRLPVEGAVARPGIFTLDDLKKFPSRTQITKHHCEEGWTAIAQWTGVPLGSLLNHVGILESARFVTLYSYDDWIESFDLLDAFHPQTLLAYGMNGKDLTVPHGAPLRIRIERQIGYKSMKYIRKIEVNTEFVDYGQNIGWAWYTGI